MLETKEFELVSSTPFGNGLTRYTDVYENGYYTINITYYLFNVEKITVVGKDYLCPTITVTPDLESASDFDFDIKVKMNSYTNMTIENIKELAYILYHVESTVDHVKWLISDTQRMYNESLQGDDK